MGRDRALGFRPTFYFQVMGSTLLQIQQRGVTMCGSRSLIAGLMIAVAVAVTSPAAAENVLRFTGISGGAVTMDPHSWSQAENRAATEQVYEALLDVDSYLKIVPQLALAWEGPRS
jgi:hypothetical protein